MDIDDFSEKQDFVDKNFYDRESGVGGSRVSDSSFGLRLVLYLFVGAVALVFILVWRSSLFDSTQYQSMPVSHQQVKIKNQNMAMQKAMQEKLLGGEADQLDQ